MIMEYPDVPLGASCCLTVTAVEFVLPNCGHPGLVTNIKALFMLLLILYWIQLGAISTFNYQQF